MRQSSIIHQPTQGSALVGELLVFLVLAVPVVDELGVNK